LVVASFLYDASIHPLARIRRVGDSYRRADERVTCARRQRGGSYAVNTILYGEDNEVNRRLVQDLLMSATYPLPSPECGEPTA